MTTTAEPDTLGADEVARRFNVTTKTLLKCAANGTLPFRGIRLGRAWRFACLDVEASLGAGRAIRDSMTMTRGGVAVQVRG